MILAAIITIAIGSGLSAQTKSTNTNQGTNKSNPAYVDSNKNGVCDNYENNTRQFANRGQGRKGSGAGMGARQGCANMQQCRRSGNGRGRN